MLLEHVFNRMARASFNLTDIGALAAASTFGCIAVVKVSLSRMAMYTSTPSHDSSAHSFNQVIHRHGMYSSAVSETRCCGRLAAASFDARTLNRPT